MGRNSHPNFRRKQVQHAPYNGGSNTQPSALRFGLTVASLSAATFGLIFFQDNIPSGFQSAVQFSRNLNRENAPPIGAYYSGCDDARAAGVAPLYVGEPGYRPEMDGDDDGIACEPYRGR